MSNKEYFLVSGGSGGIGEAVCLSLSAIGFTPLIGYNRNKLAAEKIAEQTGGVAIHLDLTSRESIVSCCEKISALSANVAGVILAGSPPPVLEIFSKVPQKEIAAQWEVNVIGPHLLLSELLRRCFRKNKKGIVIGVLSQAMGKGIGSAASSMGGYTIGKYGMLGMLAALAADYPWLKVKSISPGYTTTPMLNAFDDRFLELQRSKQSFSDPADIAALILSEVN